MRSLSNLECVGETWRAALDERADLAPEWVMCQVSPDWCDRSSHRVENDRLPKSASQRTTLATRIGADGLHRLAALERPDAPAEGQALERVQVLRQVWKQSDEVSAGQATWRAGPHTNPRDAQREVAQQGQGWSAPFSRVRFAEGSARSDPERETRAWTPGLERVGADGTGGIVVYWSSLGNACW